YKFLNFCAMFVGCVQATEVKLKPGATMKTLKCTLLLILLFVVACGVKEPPPKSKLDVLQTQPDLWIDVRTPEEYATGHLQGALNIPHDAIGDRIPDVAPDKHQAIRLYCRSGRRAGIAKATLEELGYANVFNEGGYEEIRNRQ
ncbi:MAG: rhodanese-like domain-containing protein, partial [bacterium]